MTSNVILDDRIRFVMFKKHKDLAYYIIHPPATHTIIPFDSEIWYIQNDGRYVWNVRWKENRYFDIDMNEIKL